MDNTTALAANQQHCIACARALRREMLQRLDNGDTHRVGHAMETLATGTFFPDVPHMLTFLQTCDAEGTCWFLLHGCATDILSHALEVATGKHRLQWLAIMANKSTWDVCPPLHHPAGRLRITTS